MSEAPTPAAQEDRIVGRYLLLEDLQERLAAVAELARKLPPIHESQKINENLVPGCSSRVWLIHAPSNGCAHFRADADSTLVKGLVSLICQVYEGCAFEAVESFETRILERLHLLDQLTLTRQRAIYSVANRVRVLAGTAR